jgi:GH35 family endo-1,4-beta-xylanase
MPEKMHAWDVINQVIEWYEIRPDGLTDTPGLQMIGPEYI